jgi:ribosomal protein S12 methylthiotransferase
LNFFFVSMGCAKNSVDSERLMGLLAAAGHRAVGGAGEARVGLINTCGFIQDAVKENVDAILDMELLKEQGKLDKIIVTGCLVNRYEAELREELPSVDLWTRAEEWDRIPAFLSDLEKKGKKRNGGPAGGAFFRVLPPEGRPWSRYLKVSEGCNARCSYCAIPSIRGRLRSVPVERLAEEALELSALGAKEICLVGQDLTAYGEDLYGEPALERLLTALDEALPRTWIRLLYLHPDRLTPDLLDFLLGSGKTLPYLDIPIQHIDDAVLTSMNRAPASARIREAVRRARGKDPLFALRTTIMTGFPGETEEQFGKVLDFLEEAKIDRVGAFVYSPEEGTEAALRPQVPDAVKEERRARLMTLQARISGERNALFVGRTLEVLVEEADAEGGFAWGRSYRDAPEVDGMVQISAPDGELPAPGSLVGVEIADSAEHDLFGVSAARNRGAFLE